MACPTVVQAILTVRHLHPVIAPQGIQNKRLWPRVAIRVTSAEVVQPYHLHYARHHAHHIIVAMVTVTASATVPHVPTITVIVLHLLHPVLKLTRYALANMSLTSLSQLFRNLPTS